MAAYDQKVRSGLSTSAEQLATHEAAKDKAPDAAPSKYEGEATRALEAWQKDNTTSNILTLTSGDKAIAKSLPAGIRLAPSSIVADLTSAARELDAAVTVPELLAYGSEPT